MQGERLDHVRGAVLHLIDGLKPTDTFSVVAFSDRAEVIVGGQPAQQDRTLAKAKVSTLSAHGGTEIHIHVSPTYNISGSASRDEVEQVLREHDAGLLELIEEALDERDVNEQRRTYR
jgi:urease accessory protein UreH